MYATTPYLLRKLFPQLTWQVDTGRKDIFITFDDGPHPEITPNVLEILDKFGAKATFFCVGENVEKYPDTYRQILAQGHATGNHTYNHLNGWKAGKREYFENIEECAGLVNSRLFRPPYGKIGLSHINHLTKKYDIVMWSVLSYDFNKDVSPAQCLENCLNNTEEGSIIVFHDSEKASGNMLYALPRFLEKFTNEGFAFPVLSNNKQ